MSVFSNIALPKIVKKVESEYNGTIEIWESGKTTKMVVNHTTQSVNWDAPSAKKMVFGKMVDVMEGLNNKPDNILVLGLGGATMQHFMAERFPEAKIVSIEIDEAVIELSKEFFKLEEIPHHTVIKEDACRVLIDPEKFGLIKGSFDFVIVDIYIGDKFPDLGDSGNFLAALKRMLVPGGFVIFNRLYLGYHQDDVHHFITDVENFFSDVNSVTVAGKTNSDNILIYGNS